jgi:hypothetical protein
LKQWAGEGTEEVYVKDKKGMEVRLPKYEDIINDDDADMNPIEIYAYYIGLYINNMNNGIYMNYLLSFPVTYEKRIREAILKSFERGLKKSLPESILKDSDVMSEFSVVAGTSEPAAYAICALEQYGFDLSETGKAFYGIFDFGGGTSDFDFGLWTTPEDEEIYDYCIEHFGSEGDRYLGGENLLQLIAFEVFKQNIEVCSKESIVFSKPIEKNDIPSELMGYVNSSQEARLNLKLMMEKMRPFWERSDDAGNIVVDINDFSEFQISLFDSNGVLKPNLFFQVNIETLDSIVRDRIKKGVRQFFNSLMGVFRDKYIDKTACIDTVNIFLAGNSSKSPMLNDIFNDAIQEYNARIAELNGDGDAQIQYFRLFPPLGTAAAKVIQKENGIDVADDIEKPTGKTGVAWGLIEGRAGGRIEVKEEIAFENESKFAYNLGIISKNKFKLKLERDISYDKWHRFFPAKQKIIEVAYTSLPEAIGGNLPASDENVRRKRVNVSKFGDGLYLYIKPISRDKVECAVGNSEGRVEKKTIFEISFN